MRAAGASRGYFFFRALVGAALPAAAGVLLLRYLGSGRWGLALFPALLIAPCAAGLSRCRDKVVLIPAAVAAVGLLLFGYLRQVFFEIYDFFDFWDFWKVFTTKGILSDYFWPVLCILIGTAAGFLPALFRRRPPPVE